MAPSLARWAEPGSLIVGIGNVARTDDGLGWAFVDRLEAAGHPGDLVRAYQLQLEDADLVSHFERVLFVDATRSPEVTSYSLTRPEPRLEVAFTSHALTVPTVLETCRTCFGRVPEAWLLAVRGYRFDLAEGLTPAAAANLAAALAALAALPTLPALGAVGTEPSVPQPDPV